MGGSAVQGASGRDRRSNPVRTATPHCDAQCRRSPVSGILQSLNKGTMADAYDATSRQCSSKHIHLIGAQEAVPHSKRHAAASVTQKFNIP